MKTLYLLVATFMVAICINSCTAARWDVGLKEEDISLSGHQEQHRNLQELSGRSATAYTGLNAAPAWRGRMDTKYLRDYFAPSIAVNTCESGQKCSDGDWEYPYEKYISDPTNPNSNQPVMMVHYPAGSWAPSQDVPGGTLFYAYPYKSDPRSTDQPFSKMQATLEYEVYFPSDFEWVKGGKLPGLSGGQNNGRGCGGGANPKYCFNFRLMWRAGGAGEAYLYVPEGSQEEDFCGADALPECRSSGPWPCSECNYNAGVSFNRGAWFWKRGTWNKVRMSMELSDPGKANGKLEVQIDGDTKISYDKMVWRNYDNVNIEGMVFSTWFGGGDATWSPSKDQFTLFRNVRAWRSDPPNSFGGRSSVMDVSGLSEPHIISEKMNEGE